MSELRCPRCHSNDVHQSSCQEAIGRLFRALECWACGRRWRLVVRPPESGAAVADGPPLIQPAGVAYESHPLCPRCGQRAYVYCTRRGYRYLRCPACAHRFKQTPVQ